MMTQRNSSNQILAAVGLLLAAVARPDPTDPARALLGRVDGAHPVAGLAVLAPGSPTGAQAMLNTVGPAPTVAQSQWGSLDLASRALLGRVRGR